MKNVMFDFETLSTEHNAAVVSMGAAYFCTDTFTIGKQFELKIDITDYGKRKGFHKDLNTLLWWLKQDRAAINSTFFTSDRVNVRTAFECLNEFLKDAKFIWCHATFDAPILTNGLKRLNIEPSFKYTSVRDLRTAVHFADYNYYKHPRKHTHHTALGDALHQIDYLFACYKIIKGE